MHECYKPAFSVKCTKSRGKFFELGCVYNLYYHDKDSMVEISYLTKEGSEGSPKFTMRTFNKSLVRDIESFFDAWYKRCGWTEYSFELISNKYEVSLI